MTAALALISLLTGALPAQAVVAANDSKLTGRVTGPDGKPVAGLGVASVLVEGPYNGGGLAVGCCEVTTDENGRFSFYADSHFAYKVKFQDEGSATVDRTLSPTSGWAEKIPSMTWKGTFPQRKLSLPQESKT